MKTSILIKSFNRPFYLDRCIRSICKNVKGDYSIQILDDGTPLKYIEKLKGLYPSVEFSFSSLYNKKSEAIVSHLRDQEVFSYNQIPWDLWIQAAEASSNYFMLLEDDIWITRELCLGKACDLMERERVSYLKLNTYGNQKIAAGSMEKIDNDFSLLSPWFYHNKLMFHAYYYYLRYLQNRFSFPVLRRVGIPCRDLLLNSYSVYTVAGALFDKEFWLYVCQNAGNKINENRQIYRALQWFNKNGGARIGMTNNDVISTTFSSSTSSCVRFGFDMMTFNSLINESWYHDEIDPMNSFPYDIDIDYVKRYLREYNDPRCSPNNWDEWIRNFKGAYISLGFKI